jgi:hypothetical protein
MRKVVVENAVSYNLDKIIHGLLEKYAKEKKSFR